MTYEEKPLNIVVIGLGHQSVEDHLPAIKESNKYNLVGVVDSDVAKVEKIGAQYKVAYFSDVDEMVKNIEIFPDVALVAVPHGDYLNILKKLAVRGIDIIKEKPFATSVEEALEIKKLVEEHNIKLFITLQRRFNPIFKSFEQLVKRIGKIYSIEARYTFNIARLDEGWRSERNKAKGGALVDMGYHFIDLIVWYFGLPDSVVCKLSTGNREGQEYDVEDTAFLDFSYGDDKGDSERVLGSMIVSRVYPAKDEMLIAYGSMGSVSVRRGELIRLDSDGNEVEHLSRVGGWPSAITDQLEFFADKISSGQKDNEAIPNEYFKHVALLEASYVSNESHKAEQPEIFYKILKDKK